MAFNPESNHRMRFQKAGRNRMMRKPCGVATRAFAVAATCKSACGRGGGACSAATEITMYLNIRLTLLTVCKAGSLLFLPSPSPLFSRRP